MKLTIDGVGERTSHLTVPMPVKVLEGFNKSTAVLHGPLVFALPIKTEWRKIRGNEPFADWEVHPTTSWNYALESNRAAMTFAEKGVSERPFSPDAPPVTAGVKGRKVPEWKLEHNAAAPPPPSPVQTTEPLEDLTLVPYGCTSLRITEFPTTK